MAFFSIGPAVSVTAWSVPANGVQSKSGLVDVLDELGQAGTTNGKVHPTVGEGGVVKE